MPHRLTQAQLTQVVAEVERLSQRREAELEREQVKEILQELSQRHAIYLMMRWCS